MYTFTPSVLQKFDGTYGGVMDYQFGSEKSVGCTGECPYDQFVAIGTMLAPEMQTANWVLHGSSTPLILQTLYNRPGLWRYRLIRPH